MRALQGAKAIRHGHGQDKFGPDLGVATQRFPEILPQSELDRISNHQARSSSSMRSNLKAFTAKFLFYPSAVFRLFLCASFYPKNAQAVH